MKASLLPAVLLFIITFTAPLTGWAQHKDSLPDISSLRESPLDFSDMRLPSMTNAYEEDCFDLLVDVFAHDLEILFSYINDIQEIYFRMFDEILANDYINQSTKDKYVSKYNSCWYQINLINSKIQQAKITCGCRELSAALDDYYDHFATFRGSIFGLFSHDPEKAVMNYSEMAYNHVGKTYKWFYNEQMEADAQAVDAAYAACGN